MKAFTVRRSLRMGCGESLRHRSVRAIGLDEQRAGAMSGTDAERVGWSNVPRGRLPDSPEEGKFK